MKGIFLLACMQALFFALQGQNIESNIALLGRKPVSHAEGTEPVTAAPDTSGPASAARPNHQSEHVELVVGGYLETFYSHNFNNPSNNLNALRGFDFVANSLTVSNFVFGIDSRYKNFSTRLVVNFGMAPSQFYKQEPSTPAANQLPELNSSTWQNIQEAIIGYDFEKIPGLTAQVGIMATPIGIEGLPSFQTWAGSSDNPHMHRKDYRENWNFSRSNAFIHVPDYHSGLRILYSPNTKNTFAFYVINGQNMVTDNNRAKTLSASYLWTPNERFHLSALYMVGDERPQNSLFRFSQRHLFDFHTRVVISERISVMAQAVPGFERTSLGTNRFLINALYLKYSISPQLYVATRYEHLLEEVCPESPSNFLDIPENKRRGALYGITNTLSYTLVPNHLLLRLEHRYDEGSENWFFRGSVPAAPEGSKYPDVPNAKNQHTLSFSVVGWF